MMSLILWQAGENSIDKVLELVIHINERFIH